jgi:pimeloyl-ACP methyl ester carboxylesterase
LLFCHSYDNVALSLSVNFSLPEARMPLQSRRQQDRQSASSGSQVAMPSRRRFPTHPHLVIQRALADPGSLSASDVLTLQRSIGNRATTQILSPLLQSRSLAKPTDLQRDLEEGGAVSPDLESSIQQARGGGEPLAGDVRAPMEQAFGADFSGVKVHTGSESDQLNSSIGAKAFTTGQDMFFGQGQYNPGSSSGKELVAHELTHVVQQSGQVRRKMTFTRPPAEQISTGKVGRYRVIQPARGKAGRAFAGTLLGLLSAGILGVGGDLATRMGFGFRSDRKGGKGQDTNAVNAVNAGFNQRINTFQSAKTRQGVKPEQIQQYDTRIGQIQQEARDTGKYYTATDVSFTAQDIGESGKDKYAIRGRKYDPVQPDGVTPVAGSGAGKVIILLSGSGGSNEDQLEPVANMYCRQGAQRVYALNYRGYGGSMDKSDSGAESTPYLSEEGLYEDAYRIYQYVKGQEGVASTAIVVHGFSLGGAIAANLVRKVTKAGDKLGGLVLHSSIDSAYKQSSKALPGIPGLGKHGRKWGLPQLVGLATKAQMGSFDTAGALKEIAALDKDLPVHLMSGKGADGDQLGLDKTNLTRKAGKYFSNVSQHQGTGGHLDHREISVPGGHVDTNSEAALDQFLQSVTGNARR